MQWTDELMKKYKSPKTTPFLLCYCEMMLKSSLVGNPMRRSNDVRITVQYWSPVMDYNFPKCLEAQE